MERDGDVLATSFVAFVAVPDAADAGVKRISGIVGSATRLRRQARGGFDGGDGNL